MTEITERLDKMAKWAAGIDANMKAMNASIADVRQMRIDAAASIAPQSSDAAEELRLVWQRYNSPLTDLREFRANLAQQEMIAAQVADEISLVEGNAMLDVSMEIDGNGKPLYTNETTRKAAAARKLGGDEEYQRLAETKRLVMAAITSIKSDIQFQEDTAKEFMSRSRAIIARLENETAQLSAIKK